MRRRGKLPELLAPAGDFECLVAAVKGGADAVYVGGKMFSARAYARNFDLEELKRSVAYCHLHGVKLYVTMNILLFDNELDEALVFASELYHIGVDALIVADAGLVSSIRKRLPDFELHASTQMSVNNTVGADLAYDMGCTRVVLARELSHKNIVSVTEKCKAETEVFLHGALCVCHSGQCLFSSMIGGRSGNRGECAQPCRLPYNDGKYILSLSDLSLAEHVRELIDSGVASLKIEGRMKSPDYVYTVTSIYRKLLDENRNSDREENSELARAFSRGGFTDGYFKGDVFRKMTGVRSDEDKKLTALTEKGVYTPERVRVSARVKMKLGEPSEMTLWTCDGRREITVFGDAPSEAKNSPLTVDSVKDRLSKMGNTFLELLPKDIELELDDGINLAPSAINKLRRDAAAKLENETRDMGIKANATECPKVDTPPVINGCFCGKRSAVFYDKRAISELDRGALEYFDAIFVPLTDYTDLSDKANGVYLPPVIMDDEIEKVRELLSLARKSGAKYALVGNPSHVALASEFGLCPIGDFRLNVTNRKSFEYWQKNGISDIISSPELTSAQARAVGGRAIVYGRIPLMITERCFIKENFGCRMCGKSKLVDRKGMKFPMMREFEHRNVIFNSVHTYMADKMSEIHSLDGYHFIFSTETSAEVASIIGAFKSGRKVLADGKYRRMGSRKVT